MVLEVFVTSVRQHCISMWDTPNSHIEISQVTFNNYLFNPNYNSISTTLEEVSKSVFTVQNKRI